MGVRQSPSLVFRTPLRVHWRERSPPAAGHFHSLQLSMVGGNHAQQKHHAVDHRHGGGEVKFKKSLMRVRGAKEGFSQFGSIIRAIASSI